MKRFKCKVERTDEYIIEFDENICNEEWMTEFKRYFYDFDSLEEHAENLAQFRARFGETAFIEGYGHVKTGGKLHWSIKDKESIDNCGINIIVKREDQDISVDVEEIIF